jgi:hypothetical protein
MSDPVRPAVDSRNPVAPDGPASAQRALKNFRYIVGAVNDDALAVWGDLWQEFQRGVAPGGAVDPSLFGGFTPSCGWSEFFEKFWLLKHYLDYVHRSCRQPM